MNGFNAFVGQFKVDGKIKHVLVFHCKSFKKDAAKQGEFIAFALKTAKGLVEGSEAYVAGDMNIEAKWPKGTDAAKQREGIQAVSETNVLKGTHPARMCLKERHACLNVLKRFIGWCVLRQYHVETAASTFSLRRRILSLAWLC